MIKLRKIGRDNLESVLELKLTDTQKGYVASNI